MCRREVLRLEAESERAQGIIANYKQICSDLSHRLDKQEEEFKEKKKLFAVSSPHIVLNRFLKVFIFVYSFYD